MVAVAGAFVNVKLAAHLAADGAVEATCLVLFKADVALKPGVGNELGIVGIGPASAFLGKLLKEPGKVLAPCGIKVAVLGVGLAPVRGGHEIADAAARAAGFNVPATTGKTMVLDGGGEFLLILYTSVCNTKVSKQQCQVFGEGVSWTRHGFKEC